MNVKTILSLKGSHVTTIEPTATLEAAVAMLAKHRSAPWSCWAQTSA